MVFNFELLYVRNVRAPTIILREDQTCKLAREHLEKVQKKQNVYFDKRARPPKFDVWDKVVLQLPTERNKLLRQWKVPYAKVEVAYSMGYKVNVSGKYI